MILWFDVICTHTHTHHSSYFIIRYFSHNISSFSSIQSQFDYFDWLGKMSSTHKPYDDITKFNAILAHNMFDVHVQFVHIDRNLYRSNEYWFWCDVISAKMHATQHRMTTPAANDFWQSMCNVHSSKYSLVNISKLHYINWFSVLCTAVNSL